MALLEHPLELNFEVLVEERAEDRVFVSVCLEPRGGEFHIESVALQLFSPTREAISPRMMLPIAGALSGPVLTRVELRSKGPIPVGSSVVATAWDTVEQHTATCPTDVLSEFGAHLIGSRLVTPAESDAEFRSLDDEEREALAKSLPWMRPETLSTVQENIQEPLEDPDYADRVAEDLGLDEEAADWLKELLNEE